MKLVEESPNVLNVTESRGLLQTLVEKNSMLDDIQEGLNVYVEHKRALFPRSIKSDKIKITLF